MRRALIALALLATPALAQTPLSAEEFEAYVTGKTLTYSQFGTVFGIEEYLPNRKVRWKTTPEECQYGSWFQRGAMICFVYEYSSGEHCWTFWRDGDGLSALAEGAAPESILAEVGQTTDGLACPAPDVGV
ncbi:hypothetical protein [Pseudogemmobacter humi]|uniref:Uncharacterized protein n=1 Tax=Pseudogemmobacter humi TaxID=2483812 RepID=A0A3P5XEI4_9RHOB|nr:hypothetical protein [Pseudogemmobacter humi]VDC33142.1 hypothetical protein XINFAN_03650 [Pseudogemmobacter humi]